MKALLLCMCVFVLWADEASDRLAEALRSENFSLGIVEQPGVALKGPITIEPDGRGPIDFRMRESKLRFMGLRLLESGHNRSHVSDEFKDPGFMFHIRLRGNAIELGGSVRDVGLGNWDDLLKGALKENKEDR